jgi:hypothetical protein
MLYKIQVYDDGDVYVTKVPKRDPYGLYLYFEDLDSLRRELIDYWLQEADEDLSEIERAEMGEEVRCY